jgi:hypothetical protein
MQKHKKQIENGNAEEYENTMFHWICQKLPQHQAKGVSYMLQLQIALSVSAIHTTTTNLTQVRYDLAARPEYIFLLRQEINEVLEANGNELCKNALAQMKKIDNFVKESQRFGAPDLSKLAFLSHI